MILIQLGFLLNLFGFISCKSNKEIGNYGILNMNFKQIYILNSTFLETELISKKYYLSNDEKLVSSSNKIKAKVNNNSSYSLK